MSIYSNSYDGNGFRSSKTTQIITSVSQVVKNGVDFSGGNTKPIFPKNENETFSIFKDSDYLFRNYDPYDVEQTSAAGLNSQNNADNINPVLNLKNE